MSTAQQQTLDNEQTVIRQLFLDFFDRYEARYSERLSAMMRASKSRLVVDMHDLLSFATTAVVPGTTDEVQLGRGIVHQPSKYIPLCELAVHELVMQKNPDYLKVDYRSRPVHVGFEGPVGRVLGPRELYARHLNTLVAIEGIVTRQSALRPRLLETVHYCPATNKFSKREYRDQLTPVLNANQLPTVNVMPKTDQQGNVLRTELGLSSFMDSQCAMLQEAPEASPTGQLPRSVELRFDDDLVDCVKAGDRVTVVGMYVPYTTADSKAFQSIVLVNHIVHQSSPNLASRLTEADVADIHHYRDTCVAARGPSGVLEQLSRAIAPSVYGLPVEKMAVLLMLTGGVERKAHDSHIRGDINVLLVGEPSTAKSQLLRFVLGVAPLALNTTGKGSSGVGLTAAVTVDQYSGERSLSAGAMVLADRGILCIDEFDKMSQQDRVAMHEAMEQQTVTITKASIHATLNARCSVLAAANPVYGFYSVRHKLAFNVGLPESLLSRFDLTFIILDQHTSEHNRRIGTHILRNHMTAPPADADSMTVKTVVERGEVKALDREQQATTNSSGEAIVTVEFLRRYIQFARTFSPTMTVAAAEMVSQHYVALREEQEQGGKDGFFITARTLEAIVRLATACAKLRLETTVDEDDVRAAMTLVRASVHAAKDATTQRQKEKTEQRGGGDNNAAAETAEPPTKAARVEGGAVASPFASATSAAAAAAGAAASGLQRRVTEVLNTFQREARESVELHEVRDRLNALNPSAPASVLDMQGTLSQLAAADGAFTYESTDLSDTVFFH